MIPKIVLIPTQGLCNRLRAMASAHILAKFLKTSYYIIWEKEECCNCDLSDLFSNHFYNIDLEYVVNSKYMYAPNTHTNMLMGVLNEYEYIIIKGGHEFKHPDMSEPVFINNKNAFYSKLVLTPSVETILETVNSTDAVGIHYRDFVPKYDALDGRDFSKTSPLEEFVKIIKQMVSQNINIKFFLSSNTLKAKQRIAEIVKPDNIIQLEDADTERNTVIGVKYALANLILLSRCKYIIGTLMSSFSDEACFFKNISKLCIGNEEIQSYHCYGFGQIMNHKMLLPNFNVLCDIYKDE